jgi:integrase
VEASKRLSPIGVTLNEAVEYYLANAKPSGGNRKVFDVVAEFLTAKRNAGRKASYLEIQGYVLGKVFGRDFGDRWVNEITATEVDDWINAQPWTMRTRVNYFADIRNLFGFALRKGYRASNPMASLEKPQADKTKPGILTPEEAAALLVACDGATPDMLPAVAIALFAGVRTDEVKTMQWKHVDFEDGQIEIPEEKKTHARYIPMSDNLKAWLAPYAKRTGPVYSGLPKCFGYWLNERRIAAGIQ